MLEVNEEELISRLVLRGQTSGRSDDADEKVQRRRQDVYKNETLPVAGYYQRTRKLVKLDGMGQIDDIFERICVQVDKKMKAASQNGDLW
jgi:adenylate kinase